MTWGLQWSCSCWCPRAAFHIFVQGSNTFLFLCLFFNYRLICLTSKCMHTSLPSLHPPRSGAAARGSAAAASCYDVKRPAPSFLSPCPSYILPAARYSTPDLPPLLPGHLSQTTCWCVPLFWSCRERERAKQHYRVLDNFPPKMFLNLTTIGFNTSSHEDTFTQINL